MARPTWSEKDVLTLRRMLLDGKTSPEIGKALNKSAATVRQWMSNNRTSIEDVLMERPRNGGRFYCSFEKQWKGSVPYLHWSITKPWRLEQ